MDENYEVNEVETTEEVEKSSNDLIGKIALVGAGLLLGKLVSPIIDKGVKKVKKKAKKAKKKARKAKAKEVETDDFEGEDCDE